MCSSHLGRIGRQANRQEQTKSRYAGKGRSQADSQETDHTAGTISGRYRLLLTLQYLLHTLIMTLLPEGLHTTTSDRPQPNTTSDSPPRNCPQRIDRDQFGEGTQSRPPVSWAAASVTLAHEAENGRGTENPHHWPLFSHRATAPVAEALIGYEGCRNCLPMRHLRQAQLRFSLWGGVWRKRRGEETCCWLLVP